MDSKKKIIMIVGVILAALLITGGSYAFWLWNSGVDKNVVFE